MGRKVIVIGLALVLLGWPAPMTAQPEKRGPEQRNAVRLTTAYLETPIGRARRLGLEGSLGGAGVALIDPNTCSLDAVGDTKDCTELAVVRVSITIRPVTGVPLKEGEKWRLYEIVGRQLPPLRLAVSEHAGELSRLLLLDRNRKVIRVVTLEHTR